MNYGDAAKRYALYTIVLIILFFILAALTPYPIFFLGLVLGAAFSLLNLYSTYVQVKRLGEGALEGKKKFAFGTVSRVITAVLCLLLAVSNPHIFDLVGVIIGLMLTYAIIMIEPIFHIKRLQ
ncbi:ATP synthase subunit I [Alteribacter populi]|uniref:ATP synthase subunit I n=1 Tax=Alteribacter populi TaxID=2011011 RepID=UPI000BBAAED3|nr:ATP synthase subunit I [Alteribacter populi]